MNTMDGYTAGTRLDRVSVRGAREHNLRSIDVDIPRDALVAFTGVSGSGKSSLAFGTIYAEAQRRFFESVAPYARRLIDQVGAPDIDSIEGLPPAVALPQRRTGGSARSTVGSATTVANVVRMLYSRVGTYPLDAPMLFAEDFSANTVQGACPACHGIGRIYDVPEELMVPDDSLSIRNRAIAAWPTAWHGKQLQDSLISLGYDIDVPWRELPSDQRNWALYTQESPQVPVFTDRSPSEVREAVASGAEPRYMSTFLGVKRYVLETFANSKSARMRQKAAEFMISVRCPVCGGKRLKPDALAVTFEGADITEISRMPLDDVARLMEHVLLPEWRSTEQSEDEYLPPEKRLAAQRLASELLERLSPIIDLGLGYLTLDRATSALSSGELQRIRLATQVLSRLFGVVFVLDEPSAGLHPADTEALLRILRNLRNSGNTVFYVEHSLDVIREADWIIDIGPGAGASGGTVVYSGRIDGLREVKESVTRRYLFGGSNSAPDQPRERRVGDGRLTLHNVTRNNLSDVTVAFPLGAFTAITGVSGSGKSTLINHGIPDLLRADLASLTGEAEGDLETSSEDPLDLAAPVTTAGRASGPADRVRRIVQVTQKPIGRTPRSNVATYTGVFDRIRSRFAATPEARRRHYGASRFSFNLPSGRCPICKGEGVIEVELLFLPTVHAPCTTCKGTRYNAETLEVRLDGKTVAEILAMSVSTAREFFDEDSDIVQHLDALLDVGLGYISLGQSATELSGGEAQRVKLAAELRRAQLGDTLYLLDEPTSGLHPADSDRLIGHLQRLVDGGNTVIVVEHDMRVVAEADWVIDLGPGAGDAGGQVVATGTPEEVSVNAASRTAPFLKAALVSRGQC